MKTSCPLAEMPCYQQVFFVLFIYSDDINVTLIIIELTKNCKK
ncbi:hypothetical protein HNP69_002989 [Chryseobacterium koreense]|nr:hypothetical protein [Chryseobacterium koreense]